MVDKSITGEIFADLIQIYVKTINKKGVPNISSAWEHVIHSKTKQLTNEAKMFIEDEVQKLNYPMDTSSLLFEFDRIKNQALEEFEKQIDMA
mmetsp:Transcript_30499/g.22227  ORF Transcript_30499/g.22227 Transcript_30499/m.22227 type:complete len:92 (-) Transcript_30499:980-1255(-)|eukprot:CAMPEP_0116871102 /NCGR_PEP_ID=MMETSP0463-20121206/1316_1 /TAXON_ID=181622 /ORGANISM="Strombidinopsis sp, Strain SopsisLIS2011" /LENGTH=91 /DNA_ID=CAMNT_0004508915 /DNA_START=1598 /DNA_END=1873 /DNA_ORIENTATION=-